MRHICAWCKQTLPPDGFDTAIDGISPALERQPVSHGLCRNCVSHLGAQMGMPMREFIDTLDEPVLLISNNSIVSATNEAACNLFGKDIAQIEGFRGGDVFECVHAKEPGGCGQTTHCAGCVIRRTVENTARTGVAHSNVAACLNKQTRSAQQVQYYITTEKVGEVVLLQVDEMKPKS